MKGRGVNGGRRAGATTHVEIIALSFIFICHGSVAINKRISARCCQLCCQLLYAKIGLKVNLGATLNRTRAPCMPQHARLAACYACSLSSHGTSLSPSSPAPFHTHSDADCDRFSFSCEIETIQIENTQRKVLRLSLGVHCMLTWAGAGAWAWPVRAQFCGHVTDPHQACQKLRVQSAPRLPLSTSPAACGCQQFLWHVAKKLLAESAHFIIVRESTLCTVCSRKVRAVLCACVGSFKVPPGSTTRRMRHKCYNRRCGAL